MSPVPTNSNVDIAASDETLSNVIHDFRHCMHTMKIGLKALKEVGDNDQRTEMWRIVEDEQENAMRLLEELVAIARRRVAADK